MRTSARPRRAVMALLAAVTVFTLAACGSSNSSQPTSDGATTVTVGVPPYFEYQPWVIAHQLGLDKEQGINLDLKSVPSTQNGSLSVARGDLDLVGSCHSCDFPLFSGSPNLQDFMITDQFKGFILIGRKGQAQTYDELSKTESAAQAKKQVLESLKGKTFAIHKASYAALLKAALAQVGLTLDDIKIDDFADDATAALAFTRGTGDYNIGSLPQEQKLLSSPDKYVSVGGTDILGPAGLWYSTMLSSSDWLSQNKTTALKLMAIWYRTMRYMAEKPSTAMPMFADAINKASGSNLTAQQVRDITTNLESYPTLEQAAKNVYNSSSPTYFQKSVDFYEKGNADTLPSGFDASNSIVDAEYFRELQQDKKLVSWINSPLK